MTGYFSGGKNWTISINDKETSTFLLTEGGVVILRDDVLVGIVLNREFEVDGPHRTVEERHNAFQMHLFMHDAHDVNDLVPYSYFLALFSHRHQVQFH